MLVILAFVSVALPLLWIWRLLRLDEPSRGRWLVKAADIAAFLVFVTLIVRWDIVGLHLRTAILALAGVALVLSLRRHLARPWRAAGRWLAAERWSTLASLAVMLGLAGYAAAGLLPEAGAQPLACPLAGGRFHVVQGGANRLVNHHSGHPAQAYAVDIVGIGPGGFRARGLLPEELGRYAIYGAAVVSPCVGRVVAVQDGLPDLVPPEQDPANPAGNHAVLACDDIEVELAHLSPGSLAVAPGDELAAGDPIGRVGNSGNTTEPHLHLHATDATSGRAVPVTIEGMSPVRGRSFDC
ncbi:MAG TPA: M23 family metallopeptidase [Amaricoccus sp.]|nr:M23 family metallopeptidase [Amaricoccus sp.]